MAVDWSDIPYLPMLSIRPAEMRALEELPGLTKDRLLPIIHLRPWVGAHRLESATDRIAQAYGNRRVVIAMGEREQANERPVHSQLETLRQPAHGFREWCQFFDANQDYVPAIQFSPDVPQEEAQIARLYGMDRGLVVIIERPAFGAIALIARRVGERSGGGQGVCFVIDFGVASRDHLQVAAIATGYVNTIREHAPYSHVALSASSFPDSFVGISEQPIYERRLFDTMPSREQLIYSDRGSARVERQTGGGGAPAPRVDYPLFDLWDFYRSDLSGALEPEVRLEEYQSQAAAVMASTNWNAALRVWGTQMIERTAAGDSSAISNPQKATAARINLHLQLQTFYNAPDAAEDTDEDWSG
ncbi:hypothetical protein FSB78_00460 [Sphingomonas ginsenosidivorax]|uniref:Protein beta n=1 Tax=Sphingomonas ginsenosidivorax TaxID=862135 RepID=A0A5C6UAK8_9SPHN|nr:hypothetical protein [Sphingomonas ginsenosidivorax]TXC69600.1 hypothetical protein FSB78_00460 [Sphingomonas ginsenosidivorax]